ncbi:hypothetical protein NCPPB3923_11795 [Burkholderia glumae]|nr:hypothetical protein NCPPB3923_11795 [Burkholderia glumae]
MFATLTNRRQQFVQNVFEPFFDDAIAQTAPAIRSLQFFDRLRIRVEGIEISKYDVALNRSGVAHFQMVRVGVHFLHGRFDVCSRRAEVERIV